MILGTAAYMAPEQARGQSGRQARRHLGVRGGPVRDAHRPRRVCRRHHHRHHRGRRHARAGLGGVARDHAGLDQTDAHALLREGSEAPAARHRRRAAGDRGDDRAGIRCGTPRRDHGGPGARPERPADRSSAGRWPASRSVNRHGRRGPLRGLASRATVRTRPLRVSIVHTEGREVAAPAISPDGRRVAYRARRGDGMPLLWVRDLATGEAQPIPGTEDGALPFWSPDSRDLGSSPARS